MPWTPNDAERHTHKAATPALEELWAKVANEAWNELAMKAKLFGRRTLWSPGRQKAPSACRSSLPLDRTARSLASVRRSILRPMVPPVLLNVLDVSVV